MACFERLVLVALGCAGVASCDAIAGLGQFQDVPCEPCEAGTDSSDANPLPPNAPATAPAVDAGPDVSDAADAGVDAGDGDSDSPFLPPDGGPSADYRWALWKMPNGAEAGLPNAASYTFVAGIDGGVRDTITGLTWGGVHAGITTLGAATIACYPARVPSRIELVSILDTSQPYVHANPAFTTLQAGLYWTSSVTPSGQSWTVDFQGGTVAPAPNASFVLCVQSGDGGAP